MEAVSWHSPIFPFTIPQAFFVKQKAAVSTPVLTGSPAGAAYPFYGECAMQKIYNRFYLVVIEYYNEDDAHGIVHDNVIF